MRRKELIDAVARINVDIVESGIGDLLLGAVQARTADKIERAWFKFSTYQQFIQATANYGLVEIEVLNRLELSELLNPRFWQSVLDEPRSDLTIKVYQKLNGARSTIPGVLNLLSRNYPDSFEGHSGTVPAGFEGKEIITIIIPETDNQYSSPQRIITAFSAVVIFYDFFSELDNIDANDLSIIGCDSGSDKSFDILGLASLIKQVRGLIVDIWDRKLLDRQYQMAANISLFAQALPVIEKLQSLRNEGAIEDHQCEKMKKQLIEGVGKFLDAGIITEDMISQGDNTPRLIMQPQPKLLAAPQVHERQSGRLDEKTLHNRQENKDDPFVEGLTEEETATLRSLIKKGGASIEADNTDNLQENGKDIAPTRRRGRSKPK